MIDLDRHPGIPRVSKRSLIHEFLGLIHRISRREARRLISSTRGTRVKFSMQRAGGPTILAKACLPIGESRYPIIMTGTISQNSAITTDPPLRRMLRRMRIVGTETNNPTYQGPTIPCSRVSDATTIALRGRVPSRLPIIAALATHIVLLSPL